MRHVFAIIVIGACAWSCQNVEDASPSNRSTFIRSYEGPLSYVAKDVVATADGYVMLGTLTVTSDSVVTTVIKTDKSGNQIGEPAYYNTGGIGKAIKSFSNSSFSGYIIVGDSIQINPTASKGGNIEISSLHLRFIDEDLNEVRTMTVKDTISDPNPLDPRVKTDYRGDALTITSDGRVIVLGSYEEDGRPIKPLILALTTSLTIDWSDRYNVLDRDYINGRSVHFSNGNILWASSILSESGNFSDAYITIPYVKEPLSFSNYSILGEDKSKAFFVHDIQPARASGFGYGIVGTIGERDGTGKNMFFTRVSSAGSILKEDSVFIDALTFKSDGTVTMSNESLIEDTGDALCSSATGGFILAGTVTSITGELGNGQRDILLVRVNSFGDIEWVKTIGGSGDETVSTVVETDDLGILVFGTNTIGNYSSFLMIKTNSRGELTD